MTEIKVCGMVCEERMNDTDLHKYIESYLDWLESEGYEINPRPQIELNNEIQDMRQKTTMVRPSAPAAESSGVSKEDENKFREILEMAATVKEETIRKAREDAEAIRLKAETEASERLNGLAEEREGLEKEVAALKETAVEYRRQFEELLHAQQEALEKATGLF